MARIGSPSELGPWIVELSSIADREQRRAFLSSRPDAFTPETFKQVYGGVIANLRTDLQRAERLAEVCGWISQQLNDPAISAQCARAMGHVISLRGNYRDAVKEYERSIAGFEALGQDFEAALSINGALQTLIYDGQYARALKLADEARAVFSRHLDRLRLARLDSNVANIYYRQDRFQEAVDLYLKAYREFQVCGEPMDIAVLLRNLAVAYISLNEFTLAQETYEQARKYSESHGFPLLVVKADYNIAYLHYLRGEYLHAIELYDKTRVLCKELQDFYHKALCDLDQSEIYLELNLTEGGTDLARDAFTAFGQLGMRYEAAKAATFSAIAISQQGHLSQALQIFNQARRLFQEERNELWPALIDLYKALVLYDANQDDEAEDLASSALEFFAPSHLPAKAALCELLLAAIEIRSGDSDEARRYCSSALARLLHVESPAVYQAYFMLGQAEEADGNTELARQAYEKAYRKLEDLRSHLGKEELKIAFLKNKLSVFEGLVVTSLEAHSRARAEQDAFEYIEQAKSRSLADLIAFRASTLNGRGLEESPAMAQYRDLRQKLNWTYHQMELVELNPTEGWQERVQQLRQRSREYEDQLVKAFAQVQTVDREFANLQSAKTISVEQLQQTLAEDAMLLEFYAARDTFYACLVSRDRLKIIPVTQVMPVREKLRLLQLQLAKFRLGPEYVDRLEKPLLQATQAHLEELYTLLIAPIRDQLTAEHLILVPHTFLHYLPFHALSDGRRYLIDDYSISYSPSSSIFALCQEKQTATASGETLILAVADERAPYIADEGRYVAAAMEKSRLFVGEEATEERLRSYGPQSRFIHIATHGYFRQDNPMFSSIRLGKSLLSLFDLYQLRFNAELVTLSGCGTGMNVVIGGDELIGLVRGLLYAGAQSLMVTLWEVHDQSTAEFMRDFYCSYSKTANKANALRTAVFNLRQKRSHPYYWAAFSLVGRYV